MAIAVSQNKNAGSLHLYRSDGTVRLPVAGKFSPKVTSTKAEIKVRAHGLIWRIFVTPISGALTGNLQF